MTDNKEARTATPTSRAPRCPDKALNDKKTKKNRPQGASPPWAKPFNKSGAFQIKRGDQNAWNIPTRSTFWLPLDDGPISISWALAVVSSPEAFWCENCTYTLLRLESR